MFKFGIITFSQLNLIATVAIVAILILLIIVILLLISRNKLKRYNRNVVKNYQELEAHVKQQKALKDETDEAFIDEITKRVLTKIMCVMKGDESSCQKK